MAFLMTNSISRCPNVVSKHLYNVVTSSKVASIYPQMHRKSVLTKQHVQTAEQPPQISSNNVAEYPISDR